MVTDVTGPLQVESRDKVIPPQVYTAIALPFSITDSQPISKQTATDQFNFYNIDTTINKYCELTLNFH